jgi:5,10-methylene-tetrahydrofolate dehydrogenase/methenyl tetrahydrofolate cyclohydrolase
VQKADILIVAVGKAMLVKKSWLKPGVVDILPLANLALQIRV